MFSHRWRWLSFFVRHPSVVLPSFIKNLLTPITKWAWDRFTVGRHAGISVVDRHGSEVFLQRTIEALDLLKRADERRFRRVQRFLAYIVRAELPFGSGAYNHPLRACTIDFARLGFDKHPAIAPMFYAGLLVHEATHGLLCGRGIPYNRTTRERIESLCRREDYRFKRHFDRRVADEMMERDVRDRYQRIWKTTWFQRGIALWKRKREVKRDA